MGRHDEAVAQAKRAAQIDPASPTMIASVGQALYFARRYNDAQQYLKRALELDPTFWPAQYSVGLVHTQNGDINASITALRHAATLSPADDVVLSALVYALGRAGRKQAAERVLNQWQNAAHQRYVSGYLLALSYVGLGYNDKAMQSLERAYQERDTLILQAGVEPMLDPLRSNPRFQELMQRLNLFKLAS